MSSITLFKAFVAGMTDYIAKHNTNYGTIETTLNFLLGQTAGAVASMSVPLGLQEIFDRKGIIGPDSYGFEAGALAGPNYLLTLQKGAYWNGSSFLYKRTSTSIAMSAFTESGTYYVNLDAGGTTSVAAATAADTIYQFYWDAATHTVSNKTMYAGVAVLFSGADYADCLTSAFRSKTFTRLADRLEEIEQLLGRSVQTPASADTINVNWSLGGHARITLDRALITINMTEADDGQKCTLELIQDATGGRQVTFGANIQAGTDFTLPAALSGNPEKRDFLGFFYSAGSGKYHYVSLSRGY